MTFGRKRESGSFSLAVYGAKSLYIDLLQIVHNGSVYFQFQT